MKVFTLSCVSIFLLFLMGCATTLHPLNRDLMASTNLSEAELQKVQFYLTEDLTLYRSEMGKKTEVKNGQIDLSERGTKSQIVIKANTPGVLVDSPDGEKLAVSFEEGAHLMFGPNPDYNGRYTLLAREWQRDRGIVTYGQHTYWVSRENSRVGLGVKMRQGRFVKDETKVLKGRKVN